MTTPFRPDYRVCPTCSGDGMIPRFAPDIAARGRRLKAAIVAVGLNQQKFAELVGISQKHLSQLITGASEGTVEMWESIDRALDIANSWAPPEAVTEADIARGREIAVENGWQTDDPRLYSTDGWKPAESEQPWQPTPGS